MNFLCHLELSLQRVGIIIGKMSRTLRFLELY
jgi:hypothetical protein